MSTFSPNLNLVHSRKSLCGDQEILIHYSPQKGLFGSICMPESGRACNVNLLPVYGVPEKLLRSGQISLFRKFFELVHFTFQKAQDGNYLALNTHVSGKGGMKPKIPFQPGLSLGSIVRGDVIEKMEVFGETSAKVEHVQKQLRDLEQGVESLRGKIRSIEQRMKKGEKEEQKSEDSVNQALKEVYESQIKACEDQIKKMPAVLRAVHQKPLELPFFTEITTSVETPIDFNTTLVATDSRGFDSTHYVSEYIDLTQSEEHIQDRMNERSSASQVSGSLGFSFFKASVSHSWSSAAMSRVADIKREGHASKILLINALVTTRHVRYLKNVTFDPRKLKNILELMNGSDNPEELIKKGISINSRGEKLVYLLTEAVMGGSFSAIVSFLKEDRSKRNVDDSANHSSSSTSISGKASYGPWKGSLGGEHSRQKADETHADHLENQGNINVSIEYIAQGSIPQLTREKVMREALKYQDPNLRTYQSSGSEKESPSKRQEELQKSMYLTANEIQKTTSHQEEISIHTPSTIMKAYDDFCSQMVIDSDSGIPIGFNYSILTQREILEILESQTPKEGNQ